MSQLGVERFFGKLMTDYTFYLKAVNSIEVACTEAAIDLTDIEKASLKNVDLELFKTFSDHIDDSLKHAR